MLGRYVYPMTDRIRIIKHEAVPFCGSYEVRFADRRPSAYFYWDDVASRRLRPEQLASEQALAIANSVEAVQDGRISREDQRADAVQGGRQPCRVQGRPEYGDRPRMAGTA